MNFKKWSLCIIFSFIISQCLDSSYNPVNQLLNDIDKTVQNREGDIPYVDLFSEYKNIRGFNLI